ncbi:MAG: hypothetical protein IPJ08_00725 [Burkholderiales bacterium]|nr:hypothetical protein [Burkholderiales bacterium]
MSMHTHPFSFSLKLGLVTAAWLFTASAAMAQAVTAPDWQTTPPTATGATTSSGAAVALDAGNNAYVLTSSSGGTSVPTPWLHRYTAAGVLQWSRITPAGQLVTDANGNALVGGSQIQKIGPDGSLVWTQPGPAGASILYNETMAVDAVGDLYLLAGNATGGQTVSKRSGATGALLWTAALPPEFSYLVGVLRLGTGQLYVTTGNDVTMTIARLSTTTGALLSTRQLAHGGFWSDIAIGPSGEVAAVGGMSIYLPNGTLNVDLLDSSLGTVLYEKRLPQGVSARRVAIDANRNVVLTGVALELNPTPYTFPGGMTGTGPFGDWITLKLDAAGTPLWSARQSQITNWDERPWTLRLGADGAVYVSGSAGNPAATTHPPEQMTTVKYDGATGAVLLTANAPSSRFGLDLKTGTDGSAYALGFGPQATLQHFAALAKPTALALSSASVRGGTRVTGTVRVSSKAGVVVKLSSSNPGVASVPASVSVPAGATSANFSVITYKVRTTTSVSISASANNGITSSTLTVKR